MQKTMPAFYMLTKAEAFVEAEHPRANDGEFTSGGGDHSVAPAKAAKPKVTRDKITHSPAPHTLPKEADGLPPSPTPETAHAYVLGSKNNPTTAERQVMAKGKYVKGFTAKERSALKDYAREDGYTAYTNVNINVKREADGKTDDAESYDRDMRHAARLINQAIAHSSLPEDKTLYRGGHIPDTLKVGDVYCNPEFTSTSGNEGVAYMFATRNSSDKPILKILAHKGDKAFDYEKAFAENWEESEFLFGSFQRFHVVDIGKDDEGRKVVTVSTRPGTPASKGDKPMAKSQTKAKGSKAFGARLMSPMGQVFRDGKRLKGSLAKAQTTYGQYLSALTQGQPSPEEQKYAWGQYQRLFDLNHRHMEEARAEALARQMARGN